MQDALKAIERQLKGAENSNKNALKDKIKRNKKK